MDNGASGNSTRHADEARRRKIFYFDDATDLLGEDGSDDVHYMDEEEQEKLIEDLRREDVTKNEYFAKSFYLIALLPLPFFIIRFYVEPSILDLFCITSLIISFTTVPAPSTTAPTVIPQGPYQRYAMTLNLFLSVATAILAVVEHQTFDARPETPRSFWLDDSRHFGVIPLVIWGMTYMSKSFMEAVNFGELEAKRYKYLGA
ncbi:hypothetical protein RUND412_006808 [Rhizina undulata]